MPPLTKPIHLNPPDALMTVCPPLPLLSEKADMGDLLQHDLSVIQLYGACQLKLKTLQGWVNKQMD